MRSDQPYNPYSHGHKGEELCIWALRLRGWQILQRRFTSGRGVKTGEIDIIAKRGRILAFIEVKARPELTEGLAAITPYQQQRIYEAAQRFLALHPHLQDLQPRFDAMIVAPWRWPRHVPDAWR